MGWPQVLIIVWLTLIGVEPAYKLAAAAANDEAIEKPLAKLIAKLIGVAILALVLGAGGFWS